MWVYEEVNGAVRPPERCYHQSFVYKQHLFILGGYGPCNLDWDRIYYFDLGKEDESFLITAYNANMYQ